MQLPRRAAPTPPVPWPRLLRIATIGGAFALLVLAAGYAATWVVFGGDDTTAAARAEADVRSAFDDMSRQLRLMARGMADPQSLVAARNGDTTAARRLFAGASAALAQAGDADYALTAYAPDGHPLAWDGRPSELPPDRLNSGEAWFFTRGALGLRLVYVTPVTSDAGEAVGTVAAERALPTRRGVGGEADPFQYPTRVAPVALELRFESGRTQPVSDLSFDVQTPSGQLLVTGTLDRADLARARDRWHRAARSLALATLAFVVIVLCGPLLEWRARVAGFLPYAGMTLVMAAVVVLSRLLLRLASPADWSQAAIFSGAAYASPLFRPLLTSPFDFLASAAAAATLIALAAYLVEAWRLAQCHRRRETRGALAVALFAGCQLAAGVAVAGLIAAYEAFLQDTISNTTLDLMLFSVHSWSVSRMAMQVGMILAHAAAVGAGVVILRAAMAPWSLPYGDWRRRLATAVLWTLPFVVWRLRGGFDSAADGPAAIALAAVTLLALQATRLAARFRHGSQAFRLTLTTLGFLLPAVALYPTLFELARRAETQLVETRFAPQATNHRQTLQRLLQDSLDQIDRFSALAEMVSVPPATPTLEASTDRAYQVWRLTALAGFPVTSSVELYDAAGALLSRFAFNLPDDLTTVPQSDEQDCSWGVFEEVSPFFAEERRILHAGRAVCVGGRIAGSIVVHAMLDYGNLPFIVSQSPYVEIMRPADPLQAEGVSGGDIEFAIYGWSRTPLYASGVTAWPLDDAVFARVEESRTPFWTELTRGGVRYAAYVLNDRGGVYALGFPVASLLDHMVNLAEISVLAFGTYLMLLAATALFGLFTRKGATARELLREIRASFYRKLLLAFIAATVVPVAALAFATRTYVADQMRANVEQEAIRTAAAARRVVEDLVAPRAAERRLAVDDNLTVWVSRLINQDVNIFIGPRLLATSERNLFASGLLPTRTPAGVYRALQLGNGSDAVLREEIGDMSYLVAATSVASRDLDAMLTVPLTSRELQIEEQIDTLDRRVLLGALLFVFGGAAIGYWLAERIADPVNRLTRATARIARGDLDARIAATSSDELRRLVQDFNRMAGELQRQRRELERTNRLEAWAEMARQVAHEIKNPLTPIQLNAEHLRRVHADRGKPLSPVLEDCVTTILAQVTLLRRIASEFSSFSSSPTARPAPVAVADLIRDAVDPYRSAVEHRIDIRIDIADDMPPVFVDRTLIARALTNIVENALHAMPASGTLSVAALVADGTARIRVADTGVGMDAEALSRVFEPYFSTKAAGTGLGLPNAKRNVEINGGTLTVASERERGTTVEVSLPIAVPVPA